MLPADSATLQSTLRLSDSLDADEAITSSGSSRLRIYVGTAILLIVAVAYVLYAQHVLAIGAAAPALPPAPEKSVGAAAEPVPVPSDDEVELLLNTMRFFGSGGSGQLPRNRD